MTEPNEPTEAQTEQEPGTPPVKEEEKKFSQAEVNALLAKERRANTLKLNGLQEQFEKLQQEQAEREQAAELKAKAKAEELRKDLPDHITKLLEKLTYQEQLEWLSDPANRAEKRNIPTLPVPKGGDPQPVRRHKVTF